MLNASSHGDRRSAPDAEGGYEPAKARRNKASRGDAVDLLRIVRIRQKVILGTAAVVVALATAFVLNLTPRYSATAVVMLDQRKNTVEDTSAVLSGLPADQATVQNQVQILTSHKLVGRVVDRLKLADSPEFNANPGGWRSLARFLSGFRPLSFLAAGIGLEGDAQGPDAARRHAIEVFLKHLTVAPVGYSTTMDITYEAGSPGRAAEIANAVANAYVEDQLEAKYEATRKATQWLAGRIEELSRQSQQADAAVQAYKAANNITTMIDGNSVVAQQISDVNGQLILAKTQLAEKEAIYGRLSELARSGKAGSAPQVVASTLIGTLRQQEAELTRQMADLSSRYTPRHPKMLDLQAQKANLDAKIGEEVQRIVEASKNDVDASSARVVSLQATLHELENQGAGQNQVSVKLTGLQSNAASARAMYENFLGKLSQTQNQQGIQTADARIISNAEEPQRPSFPNTPLSIGASIPAGFILGLALAFLIERFDRGFKTAVQLEEVSGYPVLTSIPEIQAHPVEDLIVSKPTSVFAEAVRGLQIGIGLQGRANAPKIVLVTSSMPGEGKTTLAISLARLTAQRGMRTILIDADLRRPRVLKALGLAPSQQYASSSDPLDQLVAKDPQSDVIVVASRTTPASPADYLSSAAMQNQLNRLRYESDLVIIDSAPVLPVIDTKFLCPMVDAVVMAVRWEKTPRETVQVALQELAHAQAPLAGMVLTRTDTNRFYYYSYGYQSYGQYQTYYHN